MPTLDFHDCLRSFFSRMYPDIDLTTVSFHEGLPFYTTGTPHAITVGNRIYFAEGKFDPCSAKGIALIAHELFHIKQGAGGPGIWFLRPFYASYFIQKVLSGWTKGRKHPVEVPAYEQQDRVEAAYGSASGTTGVNGPCQCSDGNLGEFHQGFSDAFFQALGATATGQTVLGHRRGLS
jgi:hypothetical protein